MNTLCASCTDHDASGLRLFRGKMRPFCARCTSMLDRGHVPSSGTNALYPWPKFKVSF